MSEKGLVDTVPIEVLDAYERQAREFAIIWAGSAMGARVAVLKLMLQAREAGIVSTAVGITLAADEALAGLTAAARGALAFYDQLDRLHDDGEPAILDALAAAVAKAEKSA